jgi:DNA mismatch endonuclease (patch repair protein)
MAAIRDRDTKPEKLIRSALHRNGFRFRLHSRVLPGRPDIVLPKYKTVVFVHGCFWHGHNCALFKWPATRRAFWRAKILGNRKRDRAVRNQIVAAGWRHLTIWECTFRGANSSTALKATRQIGAWLKAGKPGMGILRTSRA